MRSSRFSTCVASVVLAAACSSDPSEPPRRRAAPSTAGAPVSAAGLATVTGQAPRGAVVTLHPAGSTAAPLPDGPAVMDQIGKQFIPSTLIVRVGQPVAFRNSEDMPHNVYVTVKRRGTEVFNVSTDYLQKYTHTFDRAGEYDVTCNLHPGMNAVVIAVDTPYAAVADNGGRFAITNVPPGPYRLSVSSAGQVIESSVDVAAPATDLNTPSSPS